VEGGGSSFIGSDFTYVHMFEGPPAWKITSLWTMVLLFLTKIIVVVIQLCPWRLQSPFFFSFLFLFGCLGRGFLLSSE
jgi:hypothetical protein